MAVKGRLREVEGGEMLICRFYTQPVSTQAGADGDDKGGDKHTNCDNASKNSVVAMNEATLCDFRAIGCYSAHIKR